MNFATRLERETNTIFVGEPTGSSPNHYGERNEVQLPNTGIPIYVSSRYWQDSTPDDRQSCIAPHLKAELSVEVYRRGIDPAMGVIEEYITKKP